MHHVLDGLIVALEAVNVVALEVPEPSVKAFHPLLEVGQPLGIDLSRFMKSTSILETFRSLSGSFSRSISSAETNASKLHPFRYFEYCESGDEMWLKAPLPRAFAGEVTVPTDLRKGCRGI